MTHRVWATPGGRGQRLRLGPTSLLAALALLTLIGPLWANLVVWPVEYLGYDIDLRAGQVTHVQPGSVAAQAGLQPGDQLLSIYGQPWAEALFSWRQWQLVEQSSSHVAVTVSRAGEILAFELPRRAPAPRDQVAKIVFALLGLVCWLTGVLLGLGRRHEVNGSRLVAGFWLSLGGVLGCYVFAVDLCLPLLALLLWLMITIMPALAVALHVWFPARPVSQRRSAATRRLLLSAWASSSFLLALSWLVWRPGLADLLALAWLPLVVALLACFLGSGVLLLDAYRQVRIAHVRRQIRLITAACLITACVWLVARVVPLVLALPPPLPDAVIDLVPIIIPLAYLVSGVASNLYTLERLVRRVASELLIVTLVASAVSATAVIAAQEWHAAVIWWALVLGVLSKPLLAWTGRLGGDRRDPDRSYTALRQARQLLTTSLDPMVLLGAIRDGVQGAFDRPPMAIYHGASDNARELILVQQDTFPDLPAALPLATLTNHLLRGDAVREAHELHVALRAATLSVAEEAAVRHQGIALWCVVRQGSDKVLAVILIGTDVSFEPYRADDRRELTELMDAAGLALAHSSAYERVRQTEGVLRELFDAMRRVEDETAAELAREVHDEIINIYVQLNITSLQQLLPRVTDQAMRAELELLLESERGLSKALRIICERLHPTGLHDPMGLPGVLRDLTRRVLAAWPGSCELQVEGEAIPIDSTIQLEIYRIAREALANAVKHAEATTMTVCLRYPARPDHALTLVIADNGRSDKALQARPGHWGLHNMHESARAAGGVLELERALGGGARVVFSCPPSRNDAPEPLGARLVDQPLLSA